MTRIELILEYILNRTDENDYITNLGEREIQASTCQGSYTNYVFDNPKQDTLARSIKNIIDMYLSIEKIHWEESGKPKNHIYNDLLNLNKLIDKSWIF